MDRRLTSLWMLVILMSVSGCGPGGVHLASGLVQGMALGQSEQATQAPVGQILPFTLISAVDRSVVTGYYHTAIQEVAVTLADGEMMRGHYDNGRAVLTGDRGRVIVIDYVDRGGSGYGRARSNWGEEYRVLF